MNFIKILTVGAAAKSRKVQTNVYTGTLRAEVQPLTLLFTIFHEKGSSFAYLLLRNGTPFTYFVKNFAFLLTAVNALSFT